MVKDKIEIAEEIPLAVREKLTPLECKVLPYLDSNPEEIMQKSSLDMTSVIRALKFLESKGALKLKYEKKKFIQLGVNGVYYKKNHLPERQLLLYLEKSSDVNLEEAKKETKLSENEFKAALGVLKKKAFINLTNGRINLLASKEELTKKFLEEQLLEKVPLEEDTLAPEQKFALKNLLSRKDIILLEEESKMSFELTELGKTLVGKKLSVEFIEEVTPEIIKNWGRGKKFRKYDINSPVPKITGGKRHLVNQFIESGKKVWLELGFKEMEGSKVTSSFWNFDALFTAQDHPVREPRDTFFLKTGPAKLPAKEIVEGVKKAHQNGVGGSKGWQYDWNEDIAKRPVLRTHTTCLSAQTIAALKKEDLPQKFFAIGKCYRNETLDWKHLFEFNQTEGIVVDPDANLLHLLGYLKEFAKKLGFEKVRFQPSFFPYTEPSVEGMVWSEERQEWLEVLAAGIFRPEVTIPLLGSPIPVLAWGPGFDRLMMLAYKLKDVRDLYSNDLKTLRSIPFWSDS